MGRKRGGSLPLSMAMNLLRSIGIGERPDMKSASEGVMEKRSEGGCVKFIQ